MKFGFCTGMANIPILKEQGYDYVEMGVGEVMPASSEEEFASKKEKMKGADLPCMAFNVFIPGSFSIIQSYLEDKKDDLLQYAQTAIRRVSEVGGKVIVFGSGGARKRPDDVDTETALEMVARFARDCGDCAQRYGVTIAMEHLNRGETNILNSTRESAEFVKRVNHPHVKMLVDSYHMLVEKEDVEDLWEFAKDIVHVHVADGEDRSYPHKDLSFYKRFCEILKETDYNGGISVECRTNNFESDSRKALEFLKAVFK